MNQAVVFLLVLVVSSLALPVTEQPTTTSDSVNRVKRQWGMGGMPWGGMGGGGMPFGGMGGGFGMPFGGYSSGNSWGYKQSYSASGYNKNWGGWFG